MGSTITLNRNRAGGQTLVIVLIIMFVLITLGFVVMLVLGREITATGIARERNISDDLAQAGVRYAYSQLRFSESGADWRPEPPQPVPADVVPNVPPGLGPNSDPENPVATDPGRIDVTRMLSSRSSCINASLKALSPALEAQ